jgi:cytoskeletal protein CcmA (bactofilin family)
MVPFSAGSKNAEAPMETDKVTQIDADADVEGKLKGKDARILGRFRGEVVLSGRLHVGEGAKVEAKVAADVAEIAGEYQGELTVRSLVLLEKARVSGTLDAQGMVVREGAQVNGAVNAGAPKPKPGQTASPAPVSPMPAKPTTGSPAA